MTRAFLVRFRARLIENVRGMLVLTGSAWIYIGIAGFSRPAAHIFAGALLAALGTFPYLRQRKP